MSANALSRSLMPSPGYVTLQCKVHWSANESQDAPLAKGESCLAGVSQAFELDLGAERQAVGAERRACRQAIRIEIGHVDLVEVVPLRHVGQHHRALEDVGEGEAVVLQDRADILHGLARLRLHAAGHQLERAREVAERTG